MVLWHCPPGKSLFLSHILLHCNDVLHLTALLLYGKISEVRLTDKNCQLHKSFPSQQIRLNFLIFFLHISGIFEGFYAHNHFFECITQKASSCLQVGCSQNIVPCFLWAASHAVLLNLSFIHLLAIVIYWR